MLISKIKNKNLTQKKDTHMFICNFGISTYKSTKITKKKRFLQFKGMTKIITKFSILKSWLQFYTIKPANIFST